MRDAERDIRRLLRVLLTDIGVELGEEFDRNFERQGFFSHAWQRHRSPLRQGKSILVDTSALRRSIHRKVSNGTLTFASELPYAAIHNEGGDIRVTMRMKRYFWAKYREVTGAFGRRKDGSKRQDKRNARLSTEAEFYRAMALQKEGKKIHIPKRQFLGNAPEVEKIVREVIEQGLDEFLGKMQIIEGTQ